MLQRIEHGIERILWNSRLMVLVAVAASIIVALAALLMATVDSISVLSKIVSYLDPQLTGSARDGLRTDLITGMVKAIDGYLIAAILLIFGLGLYELFINKIDAAAGAASAAQLLQVRSLDDLKDRLAKVVLLVLIVEFFQYALQLSFNSALDLLYLAIGILLIGGAIYLTKDKPVSRAGAARRSGRVVRRRYTSATERVNGPPPV